MDYTHKLEIRKKTEYRVNFDSEEPLQNRGTKYGPRFQNKKTQVL